MALRSQYIHEEGGVDYVGDRVDDRVDDCRPETGYQPGADRYYIGVRSGMRMTHLFHFRACEDLYTVQEFQTLLSLLLIGLKKNLYIVSHGRTHMTNFKILKY